MPDLLDVINAVVAVQESLEITEPRPLKVKKAFPYSPPQGETINGNLPAWTNSWDFTEEEAKPSAGRGLFYTIHMQLYVAQATNGDDSVAAACATAFMPKIHTAFGQKNAAGIGGRQLYGLVGGVLAQTVTYHLIRGGAPTLAVLERGGSSYIGLDLFMDVRMNDTFYHS